MNVKIQELDIINHEEGRETIDDDERGILLTRRSEYDDFKLTAAGSVKLELKCPRKKQCLAVDILRLEPRGPQG